MHSLYQHWTYGNTACRTLTRLEAPRLVFILAPVAHRAFSHAYFTTWPRPHPRCHPPAQAHRAAVTAVSWSYDEALLASADAVGTLVLWQRCRLF